MHAGGSGDVLLAALITRPQSESQIGAGKRKLYVKSRTWRRSCGSLPVFAYTLWLDRYMLIASMVHFFA